MGYGYERGFDCSKVLLYNRWKSLPDDILIKKLWKAGRSSWALRMTDWGCSAQIWRAKVVVDLGGRRSALRLSPTRKTSPELLLANWYETKLQSCVLHMKRISKIFKVWRSKVMIVHTPRWKVIQGGKGEALATKRDEKTYPSAFAIILDSAPSCFPFTLNQAYYLYAQSTICLRHHCI